MYSISIALLSDRCQYRRIFNYRASPIVENLGLSQSAGCGSSSLVLSLSTALSSVHCRICAFSELECPPDSDADKLELSLFDCGFFYFCLSLLSLSALSLAPTATSGHTATTASGSSLSFEAFSQTESRQMFSTSDRSRPAVISRNSSAVAEIPLPPLNGKMLYIYIYSHTVVFGSVRAKSATQ